MKITSKILAIVILVVILGGIAASTALGWWQTEGGSFGSGTSETSETELIRGRTTFQELLDLGLPQETIEQVIGGAMPSPQTRVKTYCDENGLDFEAIKEVLQTEAEKLK